MNGSALMFFGMKLQTYEKFKSLKDNEMFKSLDENDFLMLIFNKITEDITFSNSKTFSKQISQIDSIESEETSLVKVKIEKQSTAFSENMQPEDLITKHECSDYKKSFLSDTELRSQTSVTNSKTNAYNCSCGENFEVLQLFLKHNYNCNSSKTCVKDEATNKKKMHLSDIPTNNHNIENENVKGTEHNCKECFRKFRTTSSLYLHHCRKTLSTPAKLDSIKREIEDNSMVPNSVLIKNDKVILPVSLMESPPVLICHCLMEFLDHNEYFKHSEKCGKPNTIDNLHSNYSTKSSPLKVLPNSNGKYECSDCPKSFRSILSLRQHRDGLHRSTPKFVCKNCGKGYRWCTSFHYHKAKCTGKS